MQSTTSLSGKPQQLIVFYSAARSQEKKAKLTLKQIVCFETKASKCGAKRRRQGASLNCTCFTPKLYLRYFSLFCTCLPGDNTNNTAQVQAMKARPFWKMRGSEIRRLCCPWLPTPAGFLHPRSCRASESCQHPGNPLASQESG